jgi:hypothetical protein
MNFGNCPADRTETAEAFVMARMDLREAAVYVEHITHCQACAEVVEMTREFVQAMRDAALGSAAHDNDEKPN